MNQELNKQVTDGNDPNHLPEHNIKSLLYAAQGIVQNYHAYKEEGETSNPRTLLVRCEVSLERISHLVDRAAEAANRLAALGGMGQKPTDTFDTANAEESVRTALAYLDKRLQRIQCDVLMPKELLKLQVARRHLDEIFYNLIENALDAMPAGGSLRISADMDVSRINIYVQTPVAALRREFNRSFLIHFLRRRDTQAPGLGSLS